MDLFDSVNMKNLFLFCMDHDNYIYNDFCIIFPVLTYLSKQTLRPKQLLLEKK